jgi:uncharacterized MAPEG superfamily protein
MINSSSNDPHAIAILVALVVALWLKGLAVSYVQVRARVRERAFERPEDAAMMRRAPAPEPELAIRAAGAWRNEMENGPVFVALATAAVLAGTPSWQLAATGGVFVAARVIHALAQIQALQPLRTIAWLTGVAATLALAVATIIEIWKSSQ